MADPHINATRAKNRPDMALKTAATRLPLRDEAKWS
jgi:hypothetical protein